MIRSVLLVIFVSYVSCVTDEEWESYKTKHGKVYSSSSEAATRRRIFEANVQTINQHNLEYKKGIHSYTMGINHLADMTEEEIKETYTMKQPLIDELSKGVRPPTDYVHYTSNCAEIEQSFYRNWVVRQCLGPVKSQGRCGCCWAFATTACLACHYKVQMRRSAVVPLSEQQLVDCAKGDVQDKSVKCSEGWSTSWAMQLIIDRKGIVSDAKYPYLSGSGSTYNCKESMFPPTTAPDATMSKIAWISSYDDEALRCAVATVGPVIIRFPVNNTFYFYEKGVYNPPNCPKDKFNHAMVIVGFGYDEKEKKKYWIVRNSWGLDWGEGGYAKINADEINMCGVSTSAIFPIIKPS